MCLLLDDGWPAGRICEALFIDEATVRGHLKLYEAEGWRGVEKLAYRGGESALGQDRLAALGAWVDERVPQSARAVCAFVKERFGVSSKRSLQASEAAGFRLQEAQERTRQGRCGSPEHIPRRDAKPLMDAASEEAPLDFVDATQPLL